MHSSSLSSGASSDSATRSTDLDALVSRHSAASLGYLNDPNAALFLPPALRRSTEKRPPLINIGTHARTWAVDLLVQQFLLASSVGDAVVDGQRTQVLSLGAGTDTRYWRMRDKCLGMGREWKCKWVELDFPEATATKARIISGKAVLRDALGGDFKIEYGGTGITSTLYALVPGDLRLFEPLVAALLAGTPGHPSLLNPTLPTLLLAECVLIYLPPATTNSILGWFTSTFARGSIVSYDPFGLEDNFGKVMIKNLATRNLSLPGASSTPTLDSLSQRLLSAGFSQAKSLTVAKIRSSVIPEAELSRVAAIERIDEVEELDLVLAHYAITYGTIEKDPSGLLLADRGQR